jgi:hypothetical protein
VNGYETPPAGPDGESEADRRIRLRAWHEEPILGHLFVESGNPGMCRECRRKIADHHR